MWLGPEPTRWIVGGGFLVFAIWALIPDKPAKGALETNHGVFLVSTVSIFVAEIGDKTQLATIGLAAEFATIFWVMLGSTLGLLLANIPVVLAGDVFAGRLPIRLVRVMAAGLFFVFGLVVLFGFDI